MACTAKSIFTSPLTMASFSISPSTISLSRNSKSPFFHSQSKPITTNLKLSCTFPVPFYLKNKTQFATFVAIQPNQEKTALFGLESEEQEGFDEKLEVQDSDWVGDESVEAVGDAGEEEDVVEEGGYQEPPADAKIFVGNLPYDVDAEHLAGIFGDAGVVDVVEVIYDKETERSRGFGFVTMSSVEEANKAVEMFHRSDLGGRSLIVDKAGLKRSSPQNKPRISKPAFKLYVGNVPWAIDDVGLEQVFSQYGNVVEARVIADQDTGRSRGFGFVTMSSESEMNEAIANLDGQNLDGRTISVKVALERSRRTE